MLDRNDRQASQSKYVAPSISMKRKTALYRPIKDTRPAADNSTHHSDPRLTPAATARPARRPAAIEVYTTAIMFGPGLSNARAKAPNAIIVPEL
jgi:hypothetical protein